MATKGSAGAALVEFVAPDVQRGDALVLSPGGQPDQAAGPDHSAKLT